MTSRASSEASNSAVACPSPPLPPASTISRPRSVSGTHLLQDRVAAADHCQKHAQHLAIAEIEFEESLQHYGNQHGSRGMQHEFRVIATGRQLARTAPEIVGDLQEHPDQHQHRWNPALGGVVDIDAVQVSVPS